MFFTIFSITHHGTLLYIETYLSLNGNDNLSDTITINWIKKGLKKR